MNIAVPLTITGGPFELYGSKGSWEHRSMAEELQMDEWFVLGCVTGGKLNYPRQTLFYKVKNGEILENIFEPDGNDEKVVF